MKWRDTDFDMLLPILLIIGLALMLTYEFAVGFDMGFRMVDKEIVWNPGIPMNEGSVK